MSITHANPVHTNTLPTPRPYLLKQDHLQKESITQEKTESDNKEDKNYILCRTCRRIITEPTARIDVQGSHKHVFFNPMGIVFEIGCFSSATGCIQSGPLTYEFSWFDGYAWNICLCSSCNAHLGWYYQSTTGSAFFGLILSQLEEGPVGQ